AKSLAISSLRNKITSLDDKPMGYYCSLSLKNLPHTLVPTAYNELSQEIHQVLIKKHSEFLLEKLITLLKKQELIHENYAKQLDEKFSKVQAELQINVSNGSLKIELTTMYSNSAKSRIESILRQYDEKILQLDIEHSLNIESSQKRKTPSNIDEDAMNFDQNWSKVATQYLQKAKKNHYKKLV
ncbi:6605_t:CDS:2, partial [Ambispora gerdemannii]